MKLREGEYFYKIEPCEIMAAHVILTGNPRGPYPLVDLGIERASARYVYGSETYNPQTGTPMYYGHDPKTGKFIVWPRPMMDFEVKLIIERKYNWFQRVLKFIFPRRFLIIKEI